MSISSDFLFSKTLADGKSHFIVIVSHGVNHSPTHLAQLDMTERPLHWETLQSQSASLHLSTYNYLVFITYTHPDNEWLKLIKWCTEYWVLQAWRSNWISTHPSSSQQLYTPARLGRARSGYVRSWTSSTSATCERFWASHGEITCPTSRC